MTLVIIAITVLVSLAALSNRALMDKLLFSPYLIIHKKEWFRLISHGFVHADYIHLAINMIVLYSFGSSIESTFSFLRDQGEINNHWLHIVTIYLGGIVISSLTTLKKHKDNFYYQSVGASGAVSAFVFMHIFFFPLKNLYFFGILPIPAILFGIGYLFYSHYKSRKSNDNINHDAHFVGAVFGFCYPLLINPKFIRYFIDGLNIF
jgi:membrane associated rhomboid family serine protease